MKVEGITWHAVVLEAEPFAATRSLLTETMGLTPMFEMEGWSLLRMPNGSIIDLFAPEAAAGMCPWGLNDGVVFGFRVDDIHTASQEPMANRDRGIHLLSLLALRGIKNEIQTMVLDPKAEHTWRWADEHLRRTLCAHDQVLRAGEEQLAMDGWQIAAGSRR